MCLMDENKNISRVKSTDTTVLYKQAAKWQSASTIAIAFLAYWMTGLPGAISAIIGGGAVLAGGFVASRIARSSENSLNSGAVLVGLLKAEAAKILMIVLLLWIGFAVYAERMVPLALISALAAAALLSGTAIFALDKKSNR